MGATGSCPHVRLGALHRSRRSRPLGRADGDRWHDPVWARAALAVSRAVASATRKAMTRQEFLTDIALTLRLGGGCLADASLLRSELNLYAAGGLGSDALAHAHPFAKDAEGAGAGRDGLLTGAGGCSVGRVETGRPNTQITKIAWQTRARHGTEWPHDQ